MGSVYAAHDERLGRRVAVKRIPGDAADDPGKRQRFRREAATLARLNHPAIVQIFDLVEDADGDWMVMELVEGPTLAQVAAEGPLAVSRVLAIGRQVAEGLAEAHAQGILHRDLKTENVMFDWRSRSTGGAPLDQTTADRTAAGRKAADRIKILDFGLAKKLGGDGWETPLSVTGQILGTFRAMSPEQVRGLPLDARSDLFSLGVLLYEIATGERPFRGDSPIDTLNQVTSLPHVAARSRRPEIPARLSELIDRLLEKSPELRPASAAEVAARLAEMEVAWSRDGAEPSASEPLADEDTTLTYEIDDTSGHEPGAAPAAPVADGTPGWLRRGPRTFAIAVAVVALVVVGRETWRRWLAPAPPAGEAQAAGEPDVYALFQRGMTLLDRFDKPDHLDEAIAAFESVLAREPSSAAAHAGLALAYWRQFSIRRDPLRLEQAEAVARRAVDLDDHLALARVALGNVLAEAGRHDEAIRELETALVFEPANAAAFGGLGRAYDLQGRSEEAIAATAKAVELEPSDRSLHDQLGSLYFGAARYREAEAEFRKSIEIAPDGVYGYRNLSAVLYTQGRLAEASEAIQQALAIKPEPSLYSNLGTLLFAQGLYTAAVHAFEKALELGGGNYYLYWANLADAHRFTAGHEEEARAAYLQAIQLVRGELETKPTSPLLRSRLALYLAKRGDRDEALAELAHLAKDEESKAEDLYRTAVAYEVCGERRRAFEALEAALRAGFSPREVQADQELFELRSDPRYHQLMARLALAQNGSG